MSFSTEKISAKVAEEVKEKISRLKIPKGYSIRPVLIHINGVTDELASEGFFANIIDFGDLMNI